jgi:hypothetical protein
MGSVGVWEVRTSLSTITAVAASHGKPVATPFEHEHEDEDEDEHEDEHDRGPLR